MADARVAAFLAASAFGVVGASADRTKYGNKVLRCYLQHRRPVVPVNPRGGVIEGVAAVPEVADLPPVVTALSVVTPPALGEQIVGASAARGVRHLWFQPGAESPAAVAACAAAGVACIADGSCLLVALGYRDDWTP